MRLLNVHTQKLDDFVEGQVPPYAILSHRWTEEELTFKEVLKERIDTRKRGYKKLVGACRVTAMYGLSYVWMDTCCIDKRSSAELSESINSMFTWYQGAVVCLAYLEDVENGPGLDVSFKQSVWFSRSWTLQELLAPEHVEFFDGQWIRIGSKEDNVSVLEEVTAIREDILDGSDPVRDCSVAERMSWAAGRRATRSEDVAYSLMGIFDINMPLLYGEGQKAFGRLQEEIMRRTSDTTVLCWGLGDSTKRLLASSPADFQDVRGLGLRSMWHSCQFGITNIGLEVHTMVVRWDLDTFGILLGEADLSEDTYMALVRKVPPETAMQRVGVVRIEIARSISWQKHRKLLIMWGNEEKAHKDIWSPSGPKEHGFHIHIQTQDVFPITPIQLRRGGDHQPERVEAGDITDRASSIAWKFGDTMSPAVATMMCHISETQTCLIDLSFDFDGRPCCLVYKSPQSDWRTVWQVSESFPMSESTGQKHEEHSMIPTEDRSTGTTLWFLRSHSEYSHTYARVSKVITGEDREAWVVLSPGRLGDERAFWTFRVCRQRPLFDGLGLYTTQY